MGKSKVPYYVAPISFEDAISGIKEEIDSCSIPEAIVKKTPIIASDNNTFQVFDVTKTWLYSLYNASQYIRANILLQKMMYFCYTGKDHIDKSGFTNPKSSTNTPSDERLKETSDLSILIRHKVIDLIRNMIDFKIVFKDDEEYKYLERYKFLLNPYLRTRRFELHSYINYIDVRMIPAFESSIGKANGKTLPRYILTKKYNNFTIDIAIFIDENLINTLLGNYFPDYNLNNPYGLPAIEIINSCDNFNNNMLTIFIDLTKKEFNDMLESHNRNVDEFINNNIEKLSDLLMETIDTMSIRWRDDREEWNDVFELYYSERELIEIINQFLADKGETPLIKNITYACITDENFYKNLKEFAEKYIKTHEFTKYYFNRTMKFNMNDIINIDLMDNKITPATMRILEHVNDVNNEEYNTNINRHSNLIEPFTNVPIKLNYNTKTSCGFCTFNYDRELITSFKRNAKISYSNPIFIKDVVNLVRYDENMDKFKIPLQTHVARIDSSLLELKYSDLVVYDVIKSVCGDEFLDKYADLFLGDIKIKKLNSSIRKISKHVGDLSIDHILSDPSELDKYIDKIESFDFDDVEIYTYFDIDKRHEYDMIIKQIISLSDKYSKRFKSTNTYIIKGDKLKLLLRNSLKFIKKIVEEKYDHILYKAVISSKTLLEALNNVANIIDYLVRVKYCDIKVFRNFVVSYLFKNFYFSNIDTLYRNSVNNFYVDRLFTIRTYSDVTVSIRTNSKSFTTNEMRSAIHKLSSLFNIENANEHSLVYLKKVGDNFIINNLQDRILPSIDLIGRQLSYTPNILRMLGFSYNINRRFTEYYPTQISIYSLLSRTIPHKEMDIMKLEKITPNNAFNKLIYILDILDGNLIMEDLQVIPMIIYNKIFKDELKLSKNIINNKIINNLKLSKNDKYVLSTVFALLIRNFA